MGQSVALPENGVKAAQKEVIPSQVPAVWFSHPALERFNTERGYFFNIHPLLLFFLIYFYYSTFIHFFPFFFNMVH